MNSIAGNTSEMRAPSVEPSSPSTNSGVNRGGWVGWVGWGWVGLGWVGMGRVGYVRLGAK